MRATIGLAVAGILAAGLPFPSLVAAQQPDAGAPAAAPAPAPTPSPTPAAPDPAKGTARPKKSIAASIDREVKEVLRAHEDPCSKAEREGTPCFPVSIETQGPSLSVRESLRTYEPDERRAPGAPTVAEIQQQMTGAPLSASGGVSGDPVCAAKSLIRQIRSGTNTFYLYNLETQDDERPLLTDHKLDVLTYAGVPGAKLDYIGEFSGECEAIAAWRKRLRKDKEPPPDPRTSIAVKPKP